MEGSNFSLKSPPRFLMFDWSTFTSDELRPGLAMTIVRPEKKVLLAVAILPVDFSGC
jgi:hypothetical protein